MGVLRRRVADANGYMINLVGGFRQDTSKPYRSIRQNVDQSLLTVSHQTKEMYDEKAKALQEGVHDAPCDAGGDV